MDQRLSNKVAIVTGAGSSDRGDGVGSAISITFAKHGCKVLLVDKNETYAKNTASAIRDLGGESVICNSDVTKISDAEKMVDLAIYSFGRLDILVNNVGILGVGDVTNVEEENWDNVLDTNLKSMMLTSKYAIPKMLLTGGGSIINMSSCSGLRGSGQFDSIPYSTSKGAINTLTQSMAVQHGRDNIRVNSIAPGLIYTPMVSAEMTPEQRDLRVQAAPLGTEGTPWDIALAALFLASEESRWVNGVVLPVDAGLIVTTPLSGLHYN